MTETVLAPIVRERPVDVQWLCELVLSSGRNANTVRAYDLTYRDFAKALGVETAEEGIALLLSKTPGEANAIIEGYKSLQVQNGMKPKTVNARLGALRSIVREAKRFGLVNWTLEVKNEFSEAYRDTSGPSEDQYRALIALVKKRIEDKQGNDAKGKRDLAIIRLLYNPALRRKEVAGLDLKDVDLDKSRVRIIPKRSRDDRWIEVPPGTMTAVRDWCLHRGDQAGPLFISLDPGAEIRERIGQGEILESRRLSKKSIWSVVRYYSGKLSLDVAPHKLRHGGATRVARATNGNAMAVQAFGRWAQLNTAQIYIDNDKNLAGQAARLIDEE
jgi:integrase/recombinase XerC